MPVKPSEQVERILAVARGFGELGHVLGEEAGFLGSLRRILR